MSVLDALFWVASLVLLVAGTSKLIDPDPVRATSSALGLGGRSTGRMLGGVEAVVAIAAMAVGGPVLGSLVAMAYVGFAAVVVFARRRGLSSCGCFGAGSAPPSSVHVVVDLASAAVATAAVATGGGTGPVPIADGLADLGASAILVAPLVLLAAVMVVVVDTTVADVVEATRALRNQASDRGVDVTVEGT